MSTAAEMERAWYIGIDQSYAGLALTAINGSGKYETVVKGFAPGKHGTGIQRLQDIETWLLDTFDAFEETFVDWPTHVCMEGYANGAKFGREAAGELGATVKRALFLHYPGEDVRYPTIVPPTSLKKYVTGKGNTKKNEILLATYRKWGVEFTDDNAADSYGLARIAWDLGFGEPDLAYEEEVVKALTPYTEKKR